MPAASYLHIRSGDDSPVRVLPLHGTRARVGRGAQCEIQLDDPTIGEVALVLRRRGTAWHAHAAEPGGVLTIDGSEALGQRRIAQGSTLSVGPFQIALRYELAPEADEPEDELEAVESLAESASGEDEPAEVRRAERLEEWQASLERRERWLLARKERLKWEKRWRDAGERHRARAVPVAPASSAPPVAKARMPQPPIERENPPIRPTPIPERRPVPPSRPASSEPRRPVARTPEPPRRETPPPPVVTPPELPNRPEELRKLGSVTRVEPTRSGPVPPVEEPIVPVEEPRPVEEPIVPVEEPTPVVSELIDPEALAARWAWEMSNPPPQLRIAFAESRNRSHRMPSPAREPEIAPPSAPEPARSRPLALPGQVEPARKRPRFPRKDRFPFRNRSRSQRRRKPRLSGPAWPRSCRPTRRARTSRIPFAIATPGIRG